MDVGFSNSGQLDWVGLAERSITLPVAMLSRYSQAGIHPFTVEYCKTFGQMFRYLKNERLDHVERQLLRSKFVGISSSIFYIGTGTSVIPRQIASTRGGVAFAAVALALRSCFSDVYTRNVLEELSITGENGRPAVVDAPAPMQFTVLVNEICAHVKDTGFLDLFRTLSKILLKGYESDARVPLAEDMAMTIGALFYIKPGNSFIIHAPSDMVPWIAAFCHWYLGHNVTLFVNDDLVWENTSMYQNSRRNNVPNIIFKTIVIEDYETQKMENLQSLSNEITIYNEATIEIVLERNDRSQKNWCYRTTLDDITLGMFNELSKKHVDGVLSSLPEFLMYTLTCRLCSHHSDDDGLIIADMLKKDRFEKILKFLLKRLPDMISTTIFKSLESLMNNFQTPGFFRDYSNIPSINLKNIANATKSFLLQFLEHFILLTFIEVADLESILLEKSWLDMGSWLFGGFGFKSFINQSSIYYSEILKVVWRIFEHDHISTKIGRSTNDSNEYLGASSRGLYAMVQFAIDLNLRLPPQERFRVHVGEGAIYVNGNLATLLRAPRYGGFHADPAHHAASHIQIEGDSNPYWVIDRRRVFRFNPTMQRSQFLIQRANTVEVHPIATQAPLRCTLKKWATLANFEGVHTYDHTIVVRTSPANRLVLDRFFNPFELIPHDHDYQQGYRSIRISDEDKADQTVYFFGLSEIQHIQWKTLMTEVDCFVLCCPNNIESDVVSRLLMPRTCWVTKNEGETMEDFCDRIFTFQDGSTKMFRYNVPNLDYTPSHIGIVRV